MSRRIRKSGFEDDGRVIANMNVDGMPWYMPQKQESGTQGTQTGLKNAESRSIDSATCEGAVRGDGFGLHAPPPMLTRSEKMAFSFGVLKAALLVSFVFIGALLAFILFCTEIWFK